MAIALCGLAIVGIPYLAMLGFTPTAAIVEVVSEHAPNSPETKDLVRTLRNETIPDSLMGSDLDPDYVVAAGTSRFGIAVLQCRGRID